MTGLALFFKKIFGQMSQNRYAGDPIFGRDGTRPDAEDELLGSHIGAQQLFERYGDVVYRRCLQMLRDEDAAFDALQEVFVRVVRDTRFRADCSPMTWLYRIATTHCLQQLRNSRRRDRVLRELVEQSERSTAPNPEGVLTLVRILEEQDETTRQIAYLRFVDGLTLEEIAELVGVSCKTVTRRMQRMSASAKRMSALPGEGMHG